jgi:predicted transcriptional regulator of viral defense system
VHTRIMSRSRMGELIGIAQENDGLLTSREARKAGILDSVLVRLAQRGRLERAARGVYRIVHFPQGKFSHHREAILWAQASHGPEKVALSHETALVLLNISDANPTKVQLTVPKSARLRRERPEWIAIHHEDLDSSDVTRYEGLPVTTLARTVADVLSSSARIDLVQRAIADAKRARLIDASEAARLKRQTDRFARRLEQVDSARQGGRK